MNHGKRHIVNGFVFLAASAVTWAAVTSAAEPPPAISLAQSVKPSSYDVALRANVRVAMRDGVELSTYICLPKTPGEKFPVILLRTPYGKGTPFRSNASKKLASRGYVVVVQYCRGRGESDGEWEPMVNEMADGLDMHEWLLAQPWCNGTIGTNGGSYGGYTQWVTAHGSVRLGW
jgi:predicted acyl esterase